MKNSVFVFHTRISPPFSQPKMDGLLATLPAALQEDCLKFKFQEDRQARLAGKILLSEALRRSGLGKGSLDGLGYTGFGRPYLPGGFDFNISHSGSCVAVALSADMKVGIDVETIRPIDIGNFLKIVPPAELETILASDEPQMSFLGYWTRVECVLKAAGGGLSIPIRSVAIRGGTAECGGSLWYVRPLSLGEGVCAHIAVDKEDIFIRTESVAI